MKTSKATIGANMESEREELDDTRIFGMTHAEFERLPKSEKDRLLIPFSLAKIEIALSSLSDIVSKRGIGVLR